MNELEKSKDFLQMFGGKPWPEMGSLEKTTAGEVEPWMADFVKRRHSQEDWDVFFEYCASSPLKRAYCRLMGIVCEILGF